MASQPVSVPAECFAPAAEPGRVERCLPTAEVCITSNAALGQDRFCSSKFYPSKTSKMTDARGKTRTGANPERCQSRRINCWAGVNSLREIPRLMTAVVVATLPSTRYITDT